jgi:glycerophosphoryl diester phosphodiesterase
MQKILVIFLAAFTLNSFAQTLCIAHRGYHKDAPDNSLAAFKAAQDSGADGIELDIVHTKDGIPIVNHDKTLRKTAISRPGKRCPRFKYIKKLNLAEIKEKCMLKNHGPIPTLEEALELITQTDQLLFLELKDRPTIKTALLVERFYGHIPEKLRIIAFKKWRINRLIYLNQEARAFWDMVKALKLTVISWPLQRKIGVNIRMMAYKHRRRFLNRLNRELSVWTVNRDFQLRFLIKNKVDYITTDRLEKCLELKEMLN